MAESGATPITSARSTRSGIVNGPLERLHAPDGTAKDKPQSPDAERVEKMGLGPDIVANGNERKVGTVTKPVSGSTEPGPVDP